MEKRYYSGDVQQARAYSPVVATQGGRILWLAGHAARQDDSGRSLAGNFEAQVRQTFANLSATLARGGGKLQDMVTMTVFILDSRHGDRFVEIRKEYFPEGFPASALITVAGFARPDMMVEIQGVAVVPE